MRFELFFRRLRSLSLWALTCHSMGCTQPQIPAAPDSRTMMASALSRLEIAPSDSLVVDSMRCKDNYTDNRIHGLNKALQTKAFNSYTCMKSIKVFNRSQTDEFPTVIMSFIDVPAADGKRVQRVMKNYRKGYFDSKVFNRYKWHFNKTTLILIESFSPAFNPLYAQMDSIASNGAKSGK
jgi:hypothetical protein